jgi:hypothetical protein
VNKVRERSRLINLSIAASANCNKPAMLEYNASSSRYAVPWQMARPLDYTHGHPLSGQA